MFYSYTDSQITHFPKALGKNGKLNNHITIKITLKICSSERNYFFLVSPHDPMTVESQLLLEQTQESLTTFKICSFNIKHGREHWNVEDWEGKEEEDDNGETIFFLCLKWSNAFKKRLSNSNTFEELCWWCKKDNCLKIVICLVILLPTYIEKLGF